MTEKKTLRQQLALWADGVAEDQCHGFYDWFCRDESLPNRAKKLQSNVRSFLKKMALNGEPIDLDANYVFFKNNCPASGNIYDSFSICSIEEGRVQFWATPKSGHRSARGNAEIWIAKKDIEIKAPNFRELLNSI